MMEKYPVYCSWCKKKGIKTVVNWIEIPGSHRICDACHADMMRQLAIIKGAAIINKRAKDLNLYGRT